jgi:hypothetical protein
MEESRDQADSERWTHLPHDRLSAFTLKPRSQVPESSSRPAQKAEPKAPLRLKLRERLKAFIPYVDKSNVIIPNLQRIYSSNQMKVGLIWTLFEVGFEHTNDTTEAAANL